MRNLLEELENNEAILLMYLADELPAEDRAEVDQMLKGDAAMRNALASLVELQDQANACLAVLDAAPIAQGTLNLAVHQVGRSVSQWHVRRLVTPSAAPAEKRRRVATWAYPAAIAAAVLFVVGIGWFHSPQEIKPTITVMNRPTVNVERLDQSDQAQRLARSLDDPDDAARLLASNREDIFAFVSTPDSGK